MKRLLVVVVVVLVLLAAYLAVMARLNRQVQVEVAAMKAAGHPVTIAELPLVKHPQNVEVSNLLAQADTALDPKEKGLLARADSGLPIDPAERKALLDRNARALELLSAAARYPPQSIPFSYDKGLASPLPLTLKRSFDFGALLRVHARNLLDAGKADEAMDVLLADLRLADLLPDDVLILNLVRSSDMGRTLRVMRPVALRCSDQVLTRVIETVAALDPISGLRRALQGDAAVCYDEVARRGPAVIPFTSASNALAWADLMFPPTRRYAQKEYLRLMRQQLELLNRPWYETVQDWNRVEQQHHSHTRHPSPVTPLIPNSKLFVQRVTKLVAERNVTLTGLLLVRYRHQHKALPPTLQEVAPENSTDPFTGKPLVFRTSGRSFTLYSLGDDQQDDAGDPARDIVWSEGI